MPQARSLACTNSMLSSQTCEEPGGESVGADSEEDRQARTASSLGGEHAQQIQGAMLCLASLLLLLPEMSLAPCSTFTRR